jgi:hypothetical protein
VSPTRWPHFTPKFLYFFKDSWYSFLLEAESTPGPVRPEGLGNNNNNNLDSEIKEDEMRGTCVAHGKDKETIQPLKWNPYLCTLGDIPGTFNVRAGGTHTDHYVLKD